VIPEHARHKHVEPQLSTERPEQKPAHIEVEVTKPEALDSELLQDACAEAACGAAGGVARSVTLEQGLEEGG
jgi:hypothetical protein